MVAGIVFTGRFASGENIGFFDVEGVVVPPTVDGLDLLGTLNFTVFLGLGLALLLDLNPSVYVGDISPANTNVNINITNNHNGVVKLIMNLYSYQIK
jgi:hypothetical protein